MSTQTTGNTKVAEEVDVGIIGVKRTKLRMDRTASLLNPSGRKKIVKRAKDGKWLAGIGGGGGNPYVKSINHYKALIGAAVSDEDVVAIVQAMVERGKAGDIAAAREIFDRLVGRPKQEVAIESTTTSPQEAEQQMRMMLQGDDELRLHVTQMMGSQLVDRITVAKEVACTSANVGGGGGPQSDARYDTISPHNSTAQNEALTNINPSSTLRAASRKSNKKRAASGNSRKGVRKARVMDALKGDG